MAEKKTPAAKAAPTEITPEQIAAWKKQYGKVYRAESEGKIGYLRRPTRKIVSMSVVLGNGDLIKTKEIFIENCWLGGDEELKTDDRYFYTLAELVDKMSETAKMELKEV